MSAGQGGDGGGGGEGGGGDTWLADAEGTGGSAPPSGSGDEGATGLEHAATRTVRPKTAGLLMMMEV